LKRYKSQKKEAKIISTKLWREQDSIEKLVGVVAEIPSEDESKFLVFFLARYYLF
jgi:hypothetical protein